MLHEAQQAHYFGLASNLALASVISIPATILGYDHRIGFLKPGYDADLVIWDSHPLQIGATPKQVFIDGIPQLENPFYSDKPDYFQHAPKVPNFDNEAKDAVKYEGLPPIEPRRSEKEVVIFTNVTSLHIRVGDHIKEVFDASRSGAKAYEPQSVVVKNGEIQCSSVEGSGCLASFSDFPSVQWVNLHGGSISYVNSQRITLTKWMT